MSPLTREIWATVPSMLTTLERRIFFIQFLMVWPSEHVAPLQCAGPTVYVTLKAMVKNNSRVGIYGIGGLGHLAIQYAAKNGR